MGKDREIKEIKEMQSSGLILREITEEDADEIVSMREDEEVYRYFTKPHKITKAEHLSWFFDSYLKNENRLDFIALVHDTSEVKESIVGVFGIKREGKDSKTVEVSYLLKKEARGKGYAGVALKVLIKYAKEEWKCNEFTAVVHKNNKSSIGFIKKMGFTLEGKDNEFYCYGMTL